MVDLHISGCERSVFHEESNEAVRFQKIYPAMARKFTGGTAAPLSFSAWHRSAVNDLRSSALQDHSISRRRVYRQVDENNDSFNDFSRSPKRFTRHRNFE